MKERYVALLDVLGFSALVDGDFTGEKIRRYLDCLQGASLERNVDYVVFSDSIVLSAKGDSPEPLVAVAGTCSRLLVDMLNERIPLRGAIAFGGFVRKFFGESVFVAGPAVIEAYRFEQQQNWIGVMLAPSAVAQVPDLSDRCRLPGDGVAMTFKDIEARYPWPAFIQRCTSIPFHESSPFEPSAFDGFAVVPTKGVLEAAEIRDSIANAMDRLAWLRTIAPTPAAQRKYQLTSNWLHAIRGRWHDIAYEKERAAMG
ncbi:MAG TPA: hypothetical protein VHF01_14190 [Candidatus Acidoferrum sp.]|nr:hypothetical protein [Candidatus Acidoferrum sp.]